jgi:hypothetical protein
MPNGWVGHNDGSVGRMSSPAAVMLSRADPRPCQAHPNHASESTSHATPASTRACVKKASAAHNSQKAPITARWTDFDAAFDGSPMPQRRLREHDHSVKNTTAKACCASSTPSSPANASSHSFQQKPYCYQKQCDGARSQHRILFDDISVATSHSHPPPPSSCLAPRLMPASACTYAQRGNEACGKHCHRQEANPVI